MSTTVTTFAGYYPQRSEPAAVAVIQDATIRAALLPDVTDDQLRDGMEEITRVARHEGWRLRGRPWDFCDGQIRAFVKPAV